MTEALDLTRTRDMLMLAGEAIVASRDRLTKADQEIGDGDHGVGMARGFRAFCEALEKKPADSLDQLLRSGAMAILSSSGGASGVIFGSFFQGAAKAVSGDRLDAAGFAAALRGGLESVVARGKAKVGDKTVVDALAPAAEAAEKAAAAGGDLGAVAAAAASAAGAGAERTKGFKATTGKAKALGDRSIGYVDPGALSMSLLLRAMAAAVH